MNARDQENVYCIACGYNLRGQSGDVRICPECGTSNHLDGAYFDEATVLAIQVRLQQRWHRSTGIAVATAISSLLVVLEPACCMVPAIGATLWFLLLIFVVGGVAPEPSGLHQPFVNHQIFSVAVVFVAAVLAVLVYIIEEWCTRLLDVHSPLSDEAEMLLSAVVGSILAALVLWRPLEHRSANVRAALRPEAEAIARRKYQTRLRTPPEQRGPFEVFRNRL